MVNRSTGKTPFEIVYTCFLCCVYDLAIIPIIVGGNKTTYNMAKKASQIHVEVRAHLEAANAKYKADANQHRRKKMFQESDLVMEHLWHSHFSWHLQ